MHLHTHTHTQKHAKRDYFLTSNTEAKQTQMKTSNHCIKSDVYSLRAQRRTCDRHPSLPRISQQPHAVFVSKQCLAGVFAGRMYFMTEILSASVCLPKAVWRMETQSGKVLSVKRALRNWGDGSVGKMPALPWGPEFRSLALMM